VLCSQVVFEGTLHITDRHCCFQAKDQQQQQQSAGGGSSGGGGSSSAAKRPPVAFKISHSDVESATREPNPRRTLAASDLLQVVVNPGPGSSSGLAPSLARQPGFSGGGAGGRGLAPAVHKVALQGLNSGTAAAAAAAGASAVDRSSGSGGGGRWSVLFQQFTPSSGLDGALALIEHLRAGD
jgi:hypothetical protein